MLEKRVAVLQRDGLCVAGVFTSKGLFATTLPRKSCIEAMSDVKGESIQRSNSKSDLAILNSVFDIAEGIEVPDFNNIELDLSGMTEKQVQVVRATLSIPRGETATYGEVARKAGLPGAARFVGNVMSTNRLYPLVPCHRVVSSQGLGGYGLGIKKKIELLRREGAFAD
ncbi:MAG: methylated-DNA--[protein]-cysteine S-methyltransferase [Candidatus Thorarchaeota archaeon]|jgi:methylated-DNA-[protein]-cysteine S-methyltransferase